MRRIVGALLFCIAALGAVSTLAASPADKLTYIIVANNSDKQLRWVLMRESGADEWFASMLSPKSRIKPGESMGFFVHHPDKCGAFEIVGFAEDGSAVANDSVRACDDNVGETFYLKPLPSPPPLPRIVEVTLSNLTGASIMYAFVAPESAASWGVDYLGGEFWVEPGGTINVAIPAPENETRYRLLVIDDNDREYRVPFTVENSQETLSIRIAPDNMQ